MKKTQVAGFILFLSLVVILAGFSNVSCAAPPAPTLKPIKIGWVDSLTGMYSTIGIPAKKGVDAYVTWLNKQGGIERHPIELTTYDNESDANKSILALKKAVEADSVHVVVGCSSTAISMAMAPAVGGSKVPFLSTTGTESFELANRKVGGDQHKWNFRPHAGNSIEKTLNIADYMKKKNMNKIAFFTPETSFGKSNRDAALNGFPKCGIEVVLSDTYPGDATTFGPLISKLKETPQVQLACCYGSEMASALASVAIKEAGFGDKLLIFNTITGAEQLKLERVLKAYDGLPGIVAAADVYDSMPNANMNKPVLVKLNKIWGEIYPGEKIRGTFDAIVIQGLIPIEDTFRRLLKAQPDILDKDVGTIRSAFCDELEKSPLYSNGTNVIALSPQDHDGSVLGTTELQGKFTGGKWTYLGGDMCDPVYVNFIQDMGPKVGWTGTITKLMK